MAATCSLLTGGVLLLRVGVGYHDLSWLVGAATGLAMFIGMTSRSSAQALASALSAAASAERAGRAEANEVVLAERARTARDVHDVLAHSLAGINMQLEVVDALLDTGDPQGAQSATRRAPGHGLRPDNLMIGRPRSMKPEWTATRGAGSPRCDPGGSARPDAR